MILTPTTPDPAPKINPVDLELGVSDLNSSSRAMKFILLANLCGNPAVSVPWGYIGSEGEDEGDDGSRRGKRVADEKEGDRNPACAPVGLQFIGKWWDEETLLRIARFHESVVDAQGIRRRPQFFLDLKGMFSGSVDE